MRPLLFLSDSIDAGTGLGRITHDLSIRVSTLYDYRVGALGKGGLGTRHTAVHQYHVPPDGQWGEWQLQRAFDDLAGPDGEGIIMTVWDASRLLWFAQPDYSGDERLLRFLKSGRFKRWGYFPIDSTGPNGKLTSIMHDTLSGYDRIVVPSHFAHDVVVKTLGEVAARKRDLTILPHGIEMNTFRPRDKREARLSMGVAHDGLTLLIGVVATNQSRKDWGLIAETLSLLKSARPRLKVRGWWHIDTLERYWSIPALLQDFGLMQDVVVTTRMSDEQLSHAYSACDITLAPGLGEGWGYPIVESMACGTPCFHGDYAAGAEHLTPAYLVKPIGMRLDTLHDCYRPVFKADDWVNAVMGWWDSSARHEEPECVRGRVAHLDWMWAWKEWKRWFEHHS